MAMKRPTQPTGAVPLFQRIAEQRILEAQRKGEFDNLPGKGKPLELEDLSWVPEELRIGYHVLKGRAPGAGQEHSVENDPARHAQAPLDGFEFRA